MLEKIKEFPTFVIVRRILHIIVVLAAALLCTDAGAQRVGAGIFNSLKGFGLQLDSDHFEDFYFDSFTVYADIYGIPTARSNAPGIKANYSRNYVVKVLESQYVGFDLYVGPGCTLGYVKDFEVNYYRDTSVPLMKNHGVVAALSGTFGCRFEFGRRILIDLSFCLDAGLHIRKDEEMGNISVGLYKNGIFQTPYPQVTILTVF